MEHQPDYAGSALPRIATLDEFRLAPLGPDCVQEDFYVVVASEAVLVGVFEDDWPLGLTLRKNRGDLERHDREFREGTAFSWVIRNESGRYLGCAYVYPDRYGDEIGRIFTWMRARADREELLDRFNRVFEAWLLPQMPDARDMRWRSNYDADLDAWRDEGSPGISAA
ncbi:hypothetical protein [Ovoidimarina sediminis]|uniref:hypothetical protein n=1 Tax=Ovoidimarina sediminis TaxID=3079856 RepID=UPI0029081727|nr:hypothetical protein [Rhodophyticola sp. MJ-SS7]MDU8941970.1 hypothetical protein [Rhodophyticola sp. MJ-SS7]